jgi:hypothetical protein
MTRHAAHSAPAWGLGGGLTAPTTPACRTGSTRSSTRLGGHGRCRSWPIHTQAAAGIVGRFPPCRALHLNLTEDARGRPAACPVADGTSAARGLRSLLRRRAPSAVELVEHRSPGRRRWASACVSTRTTTSTLAPVGSRDRGRCSHGLRVAAATTWRTHSLGGATGRRRCPSALDPVGRQWAGDAACRMAPARRRAHRFARQLERLRRPAAATG